MPSSLYQPLKRSSVAPPAVVVGSDGAVILLPDVTPVISETVLPPVLLNVTVKPAEATTIDSAFVSLPKEFSALTVKLDVPVVVGVPEITPAELSVRPSGNAPLSSVHVIVPVPVAESVWLYAVPTVPPGRESVVIAGAALTTIESAFISFPAGFVAFTSKLKVSSVVGVPEISPVEALSDRPPGSEPLSIPHVAVLPVATSVWLYAVPTRPSANAEVVIAGAA